MFRFEEPLYLYLLLLVPVLAAVHYATDYHRRKRLRRYGDVALLKELMPDVSAVRREAKAWLMLAAWALLVFTLARPQFGTKVDTRKRQGIEAIIAMDISNSMLAEDVTPNRLEKSKMLVSSIVDQMTDDKIGLIVYAGEAYTQLPITSDYVSAKMFLETIQPSLISTQGTDIKQALDLAMKSFTPDDKATGVVIVEEYHDFARQLVSDLEEALSDELSIIGVMSCEAYLASRPTCDVVITTIDVPVTRGTKILIGPILTSQNLRKLRDKLADVLEAKRRRHAYAFLKRALRSDLFIRNVYLQGDMNDYIDYLGSLCQAHGLATAEFIHDVHLRERVSSTAFTDCLAIPHSIDTYATQSFIAVLHNDTAVPWGRHDVNFVLLIGIAREDMAFFRDALDIIIELFSSVDDTMRLMQTDTFEEFVHAFTRDLG